jgi:hypothetical protein
MSAMPGEGRTLVLPSRYPVATRVCLSAIGMILAKHLGINGFGHDARLAWADFLLRAGVGVEHLVTRTNEVYNRYVEVTSSTR